MSFKKATKKESKLRLALIGIAGSGKTYTALNIAKHMGKKIALVDTEHGSASKYAGDVAEFDVVNLDEFHPQKFIDLIHEAEKEEYDVLILDSLSHAWQGMLDMADNETKRSKTGNSFTAWKNVTPLLNSLIDTIIRSKLHIIATMRSKQEYSMEKDEFGKTSIKKLGTQARFKDGAEFEFDLVADLDINNNMIINKSRCSRLSGAVINRPGKEVAEILIDWLQGEKDVDAEIQSTMKELVKAFDEKERTSMALKIRNEILANSGLKLKETSAMTKEEKEIFLTGLKAKQRIFTEAKAA